MIGRALCALAVSATFANAGERPEMLLCGGLEPSWSLEIGTETALYSAPDSAEISYTIPLITPAEGRPWPRALTLLAPQDTAIAIIRPHECSDTMSDRAYEWAIDVLTQRRSEAILLTGCCREK